MKYNLVIPAEAERAQAYLTSLIEKKALAEIIKVSPKRTLKQNNFLHLLLSAFGMHFGYTLAEAKLVYKDLNKNLYAYEKHGRTFYKSSRDLSKEDMAKSIDVLREWSDRGGYPLPSADDSAWIRQLDNAVEQTKYYL